MTPGRYCTWGAFCLTREPSIDTWHDNAHLCGLLLVNLRPRFLYFSQDVTHASLVAHEGSKVRRLARIISGE